MISLRTLGPLSIKVDGNDPPPELEWKKPLALLLYTAFAPRHTRSKDQLLAVLWPDANEPTQSLNQTRHLLKSRGGVLFTDEGDQIKLDFSTVEMDTTLFEQLVREKKWTEAAALVEGPFIDGFRVTKTSGFEEWLQTERARWAAKCAEVLSHEAESLLNGGSPERAEPVAERAHLLMPHSDPAVRIYVKVLFRLGRRTEAVLVGDRFVKLLKEDLGSWPEDATLRLLEYVKTAKLPPPPPKQEPRCPLVGRAEQLRQVMESWRECLAGDARVALVVGDPGMGKTRFADEVKELVRLDTAVVAISRAVTRDTGQAWIGLRTLSEFGLVQAPGVATAPPGAITALALESLLWADKFPARASAEPLDFVRAMTEVVRAAAAESPVLLVLDDAQWMDSESLQGLLGMTRDLAKSPVMFLLTHHTDPPRAELDDLRARIGRDLKGTSVTLKALTHADIFELATWALPKYDKDQTDRLSRRIVVDSGGFPLVAYAILSAMRDGFELDPRSKPWPIPNRTLLDALPVELPDNLVGAIRVGFGRCTGDAKTVLRVLAVLGDPCTSQRLGRGSDLSESRLEKALDELEWHRWVVADARGYAFVARAIRDLIRETMVREGEAQRIQARMSA